MFKVVREKNKSFHTSWLVLGLLQIGMFFSSNPFGSASLFSEKAAEGQEKPATVSQIPVRISRTVFEKELSARVQTNSSEAQSSDVNWVENAAELPPSIDPGQVPIAVEKDHIGCAEFTDLSPMRLCFLIQGDVDSVALKPNQAWLEGTNAVLDPKCVQVLNLTDARRTADGFSLRFSVIPKSSAACQTQAATLTTEIKNNT